MARPRSGTWGSKSEKPYKTSKEAKHEAKQEAKKKRDRQSSSATTSGSNSRSSSTERRKSDDASPKRVRNRSNSDASKKKGSAFMASMKSAMVHTGLMHAKKPKDGSAHPVRDDDSDVRYYHTVTAATSSSRSPMTKVMDIFRKPHVPPPPPMPSDDDRKEKKKKDKHHDGVHSRPRAPRDGSAHPVRDGTSDTQYYHTVTGASSSSRSPMTKVMDIFRNRTHASVPPEDRKRVSTLVYIHI
nr:unnamed protein product [Callosobruchus analis]